MEMMAEAMLAPAASAEVDDLCMRRLQAGEATALGELFERHHRALFQYFARLGEPQAEDLTQEVFVRMLKYRRSYRPGSSVRTWMYTIARNTRRTHAARRRGPGMTEVGWEDAYAPSFTPPDEAEASQQRRILVQALGRLPDNKRELLVLCRYQELGYAEVGALLGCSEGAVKVRVHRAVRELRQHYLSLTKEGEHDRV